MARRTTLLYLGTPIGVFTLRRHPVGWLPLRRGLADRPVAVLAGVPDHPETLFAASDGVIYQTTDGGARWRVVGSLPSGARVTALVASPRPASRLVAGLAPVGIARSEDGGARWRLAILPALPPGAVTRLLVAPSTPDLLYAVAAGQVLTSQDQGRAWEPLPGLTAPAASVALHPDSPTTFYVGGPTGIVRTRNGGRTWQHLIATPVTALLLHPARPRSLLAALDGALHQSPNAGVTWQAMPGGEASPEDPFIEIIGHAMGDTVLAITRSGRLVQLVEGVWQMPLMGPPPPVLAAAVLTGASASLPAGPKRVQTRRRRPARREGAPPDEATAPAPSG